MVQVWFKAIGEKLLLLKDGKSLSSNKEDDTGDAVMEDVGGQEHGADDGSGAPAEMVAAGIGSEEEVDHSAQEDAENYPFFAQHVVLVFLDDLGRLLLDDNTVDIFFLDESTALAMIDKTFDLLETLLKVPFPMLAPKSSKKLPGRKSSDASDEGSKDDARKDVGDSANENQGTIFHVKIQTIFKRLMDKATGGTHAREFRVQLLCRIEMWHAWIVRAHAVFGSLTSEGAFQAVLKKRISEIAISKTRETLLQTYVEADFDALDGGVSNVEEIWIANACKALKGMGEHDPNKLRGVLLSGSSGEDGTGQGSKVGSRSIPHTEGDREERRSRQI